MTRDRPRASGIGSSNGVDQGNRILGAMGPWAFRRKHSLFLAARAFTLFSVFCYREMKTDREIEILFRRPAWAPRRGAYSNDPEAIGAALRARFVSVQKSSACASRSEGSARRSFSSNTPAYRPRSAELLLQRMLAKIEGLCDERDRLKKEGGPTKGRVLGGRSW